MPPVKTSKFVVLLVLDGWGVAAPGPGNAISQARTVNIDKFWSSFPHTELAASGEAVGLPRGEPGNTETGHLNMGAGRIVYQDLARINMAIADGSFYQNSVLLGAVEHARRNNSNLHFMGLIGAGGVHSNMEHLFALIDMSKRQKFERVYLHLFTDGRDSPPTSAKIYFSELREVIKKEGVGQIASVMGRYWAMDRDLRWDRTAKAYFALTQGAGNLVKTPEEAIEQSYSEGKTDEFIEPALIQSSEGKPMALIKDNDAVVFFNFRIDRPRQLSRAFVFKDFSLASMGIDFDPYLVKYKKKHIQKITSPQPVFERGKKLENLYFVVMTKYGQPLTDNGAKPAFPPEIVELPLSRVISEANLKQLKMAESEKERFVTFYFNGQREAPFPGEDTVIVPSPQVSTYDLKPEMSAPELTDKLLSRLRKEDGYSFVLVNFANSDMVGHTGNIGATVRACAVADELVGKIADFILINDGTLIITADHGNAEEMINASTGEIETEHSSNPVPFIAVSKALLGKPQVLNSGILADISPTILGIIGMQQPASMTGRNLLEGLS